MGILDLITVLATLLVLSAFFSGGELALMMLDPIRLETAARQGSRLARLQQALRTRPQRFLSTILICNMVVNTALATFVAAWALRHLSPLSGIGEQRALVISTIGVTALTVVFGELIPKTFAAFNGPRLARLVTFPLAMINWLLTPLNWLLGILVLPLVRLLSGKRSAHVHVPTREDVGTALAMALAGGQVEHSDASVAHRALHFSQKTLADVMTPRVDIVAVDEDTTVGEALTLMTSSGFTRLPVYRASLDEVVGALLLKDLVRASLRWAAGGHDPEDRWAHEPVRPLMRQVASFPMSKGVDDTLAEIRQLRLHLAVVIDEHGGTAGIVTLEDILEELVGDIRDESDHDLSLDVVRRTEHFAIVSGRARLDQLPELAGLKLDDIEANTVGGLMMEKLGRPAVAGDQIQLDGVLVTTLKVAGNRIKLLRLEKAQAAAVQ